MAPRRRARRTKAKVAYKRKRVTRTKRKASYKKQRKVTASTPMTITTRMDIGNLMTKVMINNEATIHNGILYKLDAKIQNTSEFTLRKKVNKQYRILSVKYVFYRDQLKTNPAIAQATYSVGDDLVYFKNNTHELIPPIPTDYLTETQVNRFFRSQNMSRKVPIGKHRFSIAIKPSVTVNYAIENTINEPILCNRQMKFPWMDMDVVGDTPILNPSSATVDIYIPAIIANTMGPLAEASGDPGLSKENVKALFNYEMYAIVKWQVRGAFRQFSLDAP